MERDLPFSLLEKSKLYFRFLLDSKNRHSVHSPFIFNFIEEVLRKKYKDKHVEAERQKLLKDKSTFFLKDHGTGQDRAMSISDFAKKSLKKKKEAELLARIVTYYNIQSVLELGSSFGITSAYIARTINKPRINTIEGSEAVIKVAQQVWKNLSIKNINAINGQFDSILPSLIKEKHNSTCYFIDGNHHYFACIKYFNMIYENISYDSIIIIDDIYWSPGMKQAWNEIIKTNEVSLSIDLFELGILFFDKRLKKEHFVLRY